MEKDIVLGEKSSLRFEEMKEKRRERREWPVSLTTPLELGWFCSSVVLVNGDLTV